MDPAPEPPPPPITADIDADAGARPDVDAAAEPGGAARGGAWLTYRYRLGGDDTPEAAGTIKAPSFLSAARRLVVGRLAGRLGAAPAYLRLRAAGERELLVRVEQGAGGPRAPPRLAVVASRLPVPTRPRSPVAG
jgi:hypothetical protein